MCLIKREINRYFRLKGKRNYRNLNKKEIYDETICISHFSRGVNVHKYSRYILLIISDEFINAAKC